MNTQITQATTEAEQDRAVATLVAAFAGDPAARWLYPGSHQYFAHFPEFVRAFGGKAFDHGTAYCAEDCAAAALWLSPDVEPDEEELVGMVEDSIPEERQAEVFSVLRQMGKFHPAEPHWYLPLMGVNPEEQGQGRGSALLTHALARCDRDGLPAYLESSSPRSIPLYERHGFRVLGVIRAGDSPVITPMLRPAKGS
jgi:GNAT superfamily N-acetyltransferase